jgi:branched-chain amino acid transport system ATP-binding protein
VTAPETGTAALAPLDTSAALSIEGVEVAYGDTVVLRDVTIEIPPRSVVALVGPNGAGKTSLLKAASGLLPLRKGRVLLGGVDISRLEPYQRARLGLCHVPEGRGIYRSLSVKDNLRMQVPGGNAGDTVDRAVSIFQVLGKRLEQLSGTLSGGEQQMLAMSAAYLRQASVIMVDEPSLGLAPIIVDTIFEFLAKVPERGIALLLVDQYVHRALGMAELAYVLRRGELVYQGKADELLASDIFSHYLGE